MHIKITKRVLESTINESSNDVFLRASILKGFGVRITSTGGICFFAEGRIRKGRNKRIALGRYPVLEINEAREKARDCINFDQAWTLMSWRETSLRWRQSKKL